MVPEFTPGKTMLPVIHYFFDCVHLTRVGSGKTLLPGVAKLWVKSRLLQQGSDNLGLVTRYNRSVGTAHSHHLLPLSVEAHAEKGKAEQHSQDRLQDGRFLSMENCVAAGF